MTLAPDTLNTGRDTGAAAGVGAAGNALGRTRAPAGRSALADPVALPGGPSLTVSLTDGCDLPMDALTSMPDIALRCNPCDEAIVRLLIACVRQDDANLLVSPLIRPGTLCLG